MSAVTRSGHNASVGRARFEAVAVIAATIIGWRLLWVSSPRFRYAICTVTGYNAVITIVGTLGALLGVAMACQKAASNVASGWRRLARIFDFRTLRPKNNSG